METLGVIVAGVVLMTIVIFISHYFEKRSEGRKTPEQPSQRHKTRA